MGLVNPDRYPAYLHPDTDFEALLRQVQQYSQRGSILLWGTSLPNHWTVRASDQPSATPAQRSLQGIMEVTQGALYLVNYQHLLDAAQYDDEPLDAPRRKAYQMTIPNGWYQITVRQLFDVEQDVVPDEFLGFELVFQSLKTAPSQPLNADWTPVPWSVYS